MVFVSREGVVSHPYGCYVREGREMYHGRLFRVSGGQTKELKRQLVEAGLGHLIKDYPNGLYALDGLPVSFLPLDRTDKLGTPYATNLVLDVERASKIVRK